MLFICTYCHIVVVLILNECNVGITAHEKNRVMLHFWVEHDRMFINASQREVFKRLGTKPTDFRVSPNQDNNRYPSLSATSIHEYFSSKPTTLLESSSFFKASISSRNLSLREARSRNSLENDRKAELKAMQDAHNLEIEKLKAKKAAELKQLQISIQSTKKKIENDAAKALRLHNLEVDRERTERERIERERQRTRDREVHEVELNQYDSEREHRSEREHAGRARNHDGDIPDKTQFAEKRKRQDATGKKSHVDDKSTARRGDEDARGNNLQLHDSAQHTVPAAGTRPPLFRGSKAPVNSRSQDNSRERDYEDDNRRVRSRIDYGDDEERERHSRSQRDDYDDSECGRRYGRSQREAYGYDDEEERGCYGRFQPDNYDLGERGHRHGRSQRDDVLSDERGRRRHGRSQRDIDDYNDDERRRSISRDQFSTPVLFHSARSSSRSRDRDYESGLSFERRQHPPSSEDITSMARSAYRDMRVAEQLEELNELRFERNFKQAMSKQFKH